MDTFNLIVLLVSIISFIGWPIYVRFNKLIKDEGDYVMAVTLWLCSPMFMWGILLVWLTRLIFGEVKGEQK